jgi:signal transduction histidine kinase
VILLLTVHARRRREAALQRELREQESSVALGRLAAGIAHEVRGPLNAIGMAAQRLQREAGAENPDLERLKEIVPSVRREVARVNRTVEEFLDVGRDRPLERSPVRFTELIRSVVESEDPLADVVPPVSDEPFPADRTELRKAIANLVRNARDAAGEGPVVITWRREGHEMVLEVRDGGPGVPREDRDRIFDHFFTGRPGGTGLGLAIVRSVIARHGGRVGVDDAPEGGARFTVRIPDE